MPKKKTRCITKHPSFINKKWVERKEVFEKKSKFIERENNIWGKLSQAERENFMKSPAPQLGNRITSFFKTSTQPKKSNRPNDDKDSTCQQPPLASTSNAFTACRDRESYLNEKEIEMLRSLFKEIKVCFEDFFTEDIKGDQNIIDCLKLFTYKWDKFKVLTQQAYDVVTTSYFGHIKVATS